MSSWYRQNKPTTEEIICRLYATYLLPINRKKSVTIEKTMQIIHEVVLNEETKIHQWGTYDWYYTSTHSKLKKEINNKLKSLCYNTYGIKNIP